MNRPKDMKVEPIRDALTRSMNGRNNVEPTEDASMKVFAYAQKKAVLKNVQHSFWKQGLAAAVVLIACIAALQFTYTSLPAESGYFMRSDKPDSPLILKRVLKDTYAEQRYARLQANAQKILTYNNDRARTTRSVYTKSFSSSRVRTKRTSTFRRLIND